MKIGVSRANLRPKYFNLTFRAKLRNESLEYPLTRRRGSNVIDKDLTNKKLLFNLILTRSYLCGLGVGRRRVKG